MRTRITARILTICLIGGACTLSSRSVFAQGSSLFSGSGLTKSGTGGISGALGGTGFGSMTGGSGAAGSSALGGALGAMGANRGGLGGATGGAGGTGFGATGAGGLNGSSGAGFVGRTNTAMAGNSRAGQTAGNSGNSTRSASRGSGGGFNNNQQNQSNFANNTQTKSSSIRPRQRIAFEYNVKSASKVATNVATRLDRISIKNPSLKQVGVEVVGDQIVLSGKVKTAEQSRLAENLLRLEPGVKSIRNNLEIEQVSIVE